MIPGPIMIISCPICGFKGEKKSLISGNTFGAELWSDGKRIAPMLPEYPSFVKCRKCGSFFFTKGKDAQDKFSWSDKGKDKKPEIDFLEFPSFLEYFEALGTDVSEKFLRWMAFHSYNDYIRNNKENEITMDMRDLYFDNLKSLLYLLSEDDQNELFTIIEINRQLGRIEKCKELLDKVDDEKQRSIKSMFSREINNKNTRLFRLY